MRDFAHPPTRERAPVDVVAALRDTLIIAANAYKYVADVETDFEDLPPIEANGGELNQVFLNLVVNAAHAIESVVGECDQRGTIRLGAHTDGDDVVISVSDTGCGIPDEIAGRIFDPFFTTKEVGRGTGQGLALARTMVVERHGGTLTFETEPGAGTTFHVRLPISGAAVVRA
jgi:signal transduction histidine kinase